MVVFVDASALVSSLIHHDSNNDKAKKIIDQLEEQGAQLITTNFVIAEVLTVVAMKYKKETAVLFGEQLRENGIDVVHVDQDLFESSWQLFRQEKSKNVGFVDCMSFALIKTFRIPAAFSFDKDFLGRGFKVLR